MCILILGIHSKNKHMKNIFTSIVLIILINLTFTQTPLTIGTTTYDYQTYGSSNNHLIAYPDGKVTAAWMGSSTFTPAFTNLGTYYNHFNGVSWGSFPTARLETAKTYSTEILTVMSHEVVVADDVSRVLLFKNTTIGGTSWTETGGSDVIDGWYPMAYCPEGTDDIYVVTMKPNQEDLLFSRSDDGGETWAILEYALPNTTEAWGCDLVLPDCYQVVVYGNDVYVLYGSLVSDLILMHSGNKGLTWDASPTVLVNFPIDNYVAGAGETTDWDGDGDYDWVDTNDGRHEMIVTDDGTVHVFAGRMQIRDVAGVTGFYYDFLKAGIYHWKTGDVGATLHEEFVIDWDGDGDPFSGITDNLDAYNWESFTFMPTASYDADIDRIYMSYMMPVEGEVSASDQNYSDLFGTYSDDGGDTWSDPINLTYSAFLGKENAYPSASPRTVGNKFHVMWQQDDEPGTSQDPAPGDDDILTNNMKYVAWEETRFEPYNPTVDFTFTLSPGFTATFTNLSVDAEDYLWDFGDGFTSTAINPTHTYSPGTYEVCLTGYNHYGEATECQTVVAVNEPVADFISFGDPDVSFVDLSTGDPDTWYWDFGDGFTSTESDPVHTYLTNGTYTVCLTVSNLAGSDTYCDDVTIDSYLAPTAYFIHSGDPIVTFTDLSTGGPTSWFWDFDDGFTSTLQNPIHTYTENGTYNVCLTATNGVGSSTTCQDVVISSYTAPVAYFSHTGDPFVTFTDLSTNEPDEWFWDFGDGITSTLENPTHNFTENGTYEVCLTATNDIGSDTYCENIVIDGYAAPVALFSFSGDPDVSFTDLSTGDPTSWSWDFDDGDFSTLQNPDHTFVEDGTYNVCLTVEGPGGSDEGCMNVIINNAGSAPIAGFTYVISGPLTVTFTDISINDPTDWVWDFGDGAISGIQNTAHTYATIGSYNVCLTATNAAGFNTYCKLIELTNAIDDIAMKVISIYPNPSSDIIFINTNDINGQYNLELYNSIGQKIELNYSDNNNIIEMNVVGLPSGNYYVKIIAEEGEFIGRFLKD